MRLGEVCAVEKRQGIHRGLPYVGLENIEGRTGRFTGSTEPLLMKSATFKFSRDHVLYGRLRPYLNKVMLPDFTGHCSTEIFPLKPRPELAREFLRYWFLKDETVEQIDATSTGTRMPRANMSAVLDLALPLPPLSEQHRLVSILDEAVEGIAAAKANAAKSLKNARAVFESYLDSVFAQHGEGWAENTKPLAGLCEFIVDCEHKTAPTQEDGVPSIRTPNVGRGQLLLDGVYRVSEDTYREWTRRAAPTAGDLILAREAPAGNVAVIPEGLRVCLGQRTVLIRPKRSVLDSEFLMLMLLWAPTQKRLLGHSRGATVQHVNMKDIRALIIGPIPTLQTQRRVVSAVSEASKQSEHLEALYQRKLVALEELRKSILNQAFSGEL